MVSVVSMSEATLAAIKDTDGIKKITDPIGIGAGTESIGKVKIESGDGTGLVANVDGTNRLTVTSALIVPTGYTDESTTVQGNVAGSSSVDTDHVVPDGKTLSVSQFFGGGEVQTGKQSKFELYHSTDGGATDGALLAVGYIGGSNNFRVDLAHEVLGDAAGNNVLRLRRERMDGTALELAAGWTGIQSL